MNNSSENLSHKYNPARIHFAQPLTRKEGSSSPTRTTSISEGEQAILWIICIVIALIFRQLAIVLIPIFLFWCFCQNIFTASEYNAPNLSNSVSSLCKRNSWQMISSDETLANDKRGYIGRGEKGVYQSLINCGLSAHHQVRTRTYTADILCVDPISCKACIVEIDGIQHWENPENIEKDYRRMSDMAQVGVSTIRFKNSFAEKYPHRCRDEIIKLLK